jgi:hypothetical protein
VGIGKFFAIVVGASFTFAAFALSDESKDYIVYLAWIGGGLISKREDFD